MSAYLHPVRTITLSLFLSIQFFPSLPISSAGEDPSPLPYQSVKMSGSSSESGSNGCCRDGSEIILFGVRVKVDPMRKSLSMNNLSQYVEQQQESSNVASDVYAGYASADETIRHQFSGNRERKRGVPWTEDEHKLFLLGLQQAGKGDWRRISRNFVKTRTPTQVASHAQKYFLRKNNLNRRRRRTSLFDITAESVEDPMENHENNESTSLIRPISVLPIANGTSVNHKLNQKPTVDPSPLSLKLSLSTDQSRQMSRHSAFQVMPSFNDTDNVGNVISVA